MQAVCADHQIEPTCARAFELHLNAVVVVVKTDNFVVENSFGRILTFSYSSRDRSLRPPSQSALGKFIENLVSKPVTRFPRSSTIRTSLTW